MARTSRTWSTARAVVAALGALLLAVLVGVTAVPAAAVAPVGWLHTSGSQIVDERGRDHVIRAVSWFGMETTNCAPHGLWTISLDAGLDQIASFGFNAIRLPFSNECLASTNEVSGVDFTRNPALAGRTPQQVMDVVVAAAKARGLSVILDRHRPDSGSQSALWYTSAWSEQRWIDGWTALATRYRDEPTVVAVDLHNEPHAEACWGCGDTRRDWAAAAERAGNAVLAANPRLLVVVEGVENTSAGSTWWGGGLADVRTRPVRLSVTNRVVYSPHEYPASVYGQPWFSAPDYPNNLPARWDAQWGYLQKQGIAPVLVGEFGTKLQTRSDEQWLSTLVGYLQANQTSFAYWSFNPNSGDTGGLVADDWVTPQRAKLAALQPILGPSGGATTTPTPTPTPTPTRTPTASPTPTATASPGTRSVTAADGLRADWGVQSSWSSGYVVNVTLTAAKARTGWRMSWSDPAATSVVNAWGMTCAVAGKTVTCTGADWGANLAPGQKVTVGVQVTTTAAAPTGAGLTLS